MAPPTLDQLVKGAPAPNSALNKAAEAVNNDPPHYSTTMLADPPHDANDRLPTIKTRSPTLSDPVSLLPSSPPQIYLNLLILEASLRSQYLTLRARRRQNTFVLTLLAFWIGFCFYLLWLRPREDGKGIGGSQYWLVDMLQKVGFITGVVTALLFWATGQWERGVRWPRRWIGVANRGLRGMNAKIVVIRGPWWRELVEWGHFVVPFTGGLWGGEQGGSSYHFINVVQENKHSLDGGRPRHRIVEDGKEYAEEDIAPGGDYIKLLLLPKPFTPDFRQEWEVYRSEYWANENERRAELRKRIRARQHEIAREEGGWLWWTGWRGWKRARGVSGRAADVEKTSHHRHTHSSHGLSHNVIDALEEWRIERGLERFTLLGHSLGGYLAIAYALKYPGHLNKLILASPVGIPEDPYAVNADLPDPQDSTLANEFTQDAAETRNGVQPSTVDNNNFMNQAKKNDTAKGDKQPPKRRLPGWLYYLWEANMISPFTFVRWSGPLGPRLVSGWTSRRFSQLPEEEAQALHDYSYALFRQRGSSEYALAYLLAPGAFARSPMIRRIQGVGRQWIEAHKTPTVDGDAPPNASASTSPQRETGFPIILMYGENDWMDVKGGYAAEEKIKQERKRILADASAEEKKRDHGEAKVVIINKAGHHVYLDGWDQFNQVMLAEMEDVKNRERARIRS